MTTVVWVSGRTPVSKASFTKTQLDILIMKLCICEFSLLADDPLNDLAEICFQVETKIEELCNIMNTVFQLHKGSYLSMLLWDFLFQAAHTGIT